MMRTRLSITIILALFTVSLPAIGSAQNHVPGCRTEEPSACRIGANARLDNIGINNFSPSSPVTFELFSSPGGSRIFGPVTKTTDARGSQSVVRGLPDMTPGNVVVVTDLVTGVVKTLHVSALTVDVVDVGTDTVSGTARPNDAVLVVLQEQSGASTQANTTADDAGRWAVDFGEQNVDLHQQYVQAHVYDVDLDGTAADPAPGCPARWQGGFHWYCFVTGSIENVWVGLGNFAPTTEVTVEVFDAPSGASIYGPRTVTTNQRGGYFFDSLGFSSGIDLRPGSVISATDSVTGTVKTLELVPLSIDRVDPVTDVVEGAGPARANLKVEGGPQLEDVTIGDDGTWRIDYSLLGYDVVSEDAFNVNFLDTDGDITTDELGAPIPGCEDDADTTCGSAGPDTIRESDGEVISGLGGDTLLISSDDPSNSVRIVAGSGSDGIVLPAHAGKLEVSVFGGAGADRMITRSFGGGGASSGSYFLDGGGGNDKLKGGDGDDTLHGGGGTNDFKGGPGQDTCLSDTRRDDFKGCERIRRNHRRNHQQA